MLCEEYWRADVKSPSVGTLYVRSRNIGTKAIESRVCHEVEAREDRGSFPASHQVPPSTTPAGIAIEINAIPC